MKKFSWIKAQTCINGSISTLYAWYILKKKQMVEVIFWIGSKHQEDVQLYQQKQFG